MINLFASREGRRQETTLKGGGGRNRVSWLPPPSLQTEADRGAARYAQLCHLLMWEHSVTVASKCPPQLLVHCCKLYMQKGGPFSSEWSSDGRLLPSLSFRNCGFQVSSAFGELPVVIVNPQSVSCLRRRQLPLQSALTRWSHMRPSLTCDPGRGWGSQQELL